MTNVRRWITVLDDTRIEASQSVERPWCRCAVAAVIRNPWYGRGFVEDLSEEVAAIAPSLAFKLVEMLLETLGGEDAVEAFGKGAIVGLGGEIEHGAALIHTPHYGDHFRHLVRGSSVINFADSRSQAGSPLSIPVWHKTTNTSRSHYATVDIRVPSAPDNDEIVVIAAAANGPRPFARIGDRRTDSVPAS